jgi:phosphohistidine phosphatase
MTLTLIALRHAKSGHDANVADIDRTLNERGRHEASEMARLMAVRGFRPARILCSSAQRTRETLMPLIAQLGGNAWIEITRRMYDAGSEDLLELIREQDGEASSLLVIGHNPGLEELVRALAGGGDGAALLQLRMKFPPAALAVLSFVAADWRDAAPGLGRLEAFETPGD